ncbi:MAG: FAD-linked oxidase C-terminal domain-containing protein [Gammaproteobacteria bacterium]|jgi:D-lactate dehydrogenase
MPEPLAPAVLAELARIFGAAAVLTAPEDCLPYGYDNSRRQAMPRAVVFATGHAQVVDLLRLANRQGLAVVARGRGTGTTGATVPLDGAIVLSLERMNRILEVDPDNRLARVEPGVINQDLQDAVGAHGFFWPPDPTSAGYSTIGGNLAYNSAGPRAVKYGTPRENTLGLRAVTGAAEEIRTGVMTTKGVVGYDFTRLLIGSEGTLAIITEATLKLTPLPQAKRTLQAVYADIHAAAAAVKAVMRQPTVPCALEFMDGAAIGMVRDYADLDLGARAGALLMMEVDGSAGAVDEAAQAVAAAADVPGCLAVEVARTAADIAHLWRARKALSPALRNIAPNKINEDVVVPVAHIPDLIEGLEGLARSHGIPIVNFGHAGNGNIHVNLLVDPENAPQMAALDPCLDAVFELVLRLDGTLSGEHGVGLAKRDFVDREIDPTTLELMRRVKSQFDPEGVLNPGKALPPRPAA